MFLACTFVCWLGLSLDDWRLPPFPNSRRVNNFVHCFLFFLFSLF
jgi:hypothetical protein